MALTELFVIALLGIQGVFSISHDDVTHKITDHKFLQRQVDILKLYKHIREPLHDPELKTVAESWSLENNVENFKNATAFKIYMEMKDFLLPRSVSFNVFEPSHKFEAETIYNLLISAKNYDTFYKTAVSLKAHVNEVMYIYVLSMAILNHHETKGLMIPPLYDVLPSYFHNGIVMKLAEKVNTYGKHIVKHEPSTFLWSDNVAIKWNTTIWPFVHDDEASVAYITHDHVFNMLHYNMHLTYPYWLSENDLSLPKNRRGMFIWFVHKQILDLYYMARLSNGLGEIPELDFDVIHEGYDSGMVYSNGVPFPVRPNHFSLSEPEYIEITQKIVELEYRIRDAIDLGYVISESGKKISLRNADGLHILANIIEGNADSPNLSYYGSVLNLWKKLLGNAKETHQYYNGVPLVVPSPLETYQTAIRDPAFYMIWKRMFNLFSMHQAHLPPYSRKTLALPSVQILDVEVDKLLTYFEYSYINVTNELPLKQGEADQVSVFVQKPVQNHKNFQVRVKVKSEEAKKVYVKFFMGPKYDSEGVEIPLHKNTENFMEIDEFVYELPEGETEIKRTCTEHKYLWDKWASFSEIYDKAVNALHNKGEFNLDPLQFGRFTNQFRLPKGRVGGMPFLLMVYITEYHEPEPYDNPAIHGAVGFDITTRYHLGYYSMGYPLDRPLYQRQVEDLTNIWIKEVQVYHKPNPEICFPEKLRHF